MLRYPHIQELLILIKKDNSNKNIFDKKHYIGWWKIKYELLAN